MNEPLLIEDQSPWCDLPDLILEKIFSYLTIRERYYCSQVCRRWNDAFYLPYVWSIFTFDERTLTRRRFNYYSGWQYTLDHLRAQLCLSTVGRHFRVLIFAPTTDFFNMYEFMNMLSYYAEQQGEDRLTVKGIGKHVHTLRYTFPCDLLARFEEDQVSRLYGTGGKVLGAVRRLMGNLQDLRHLQLTDLLLDSAEAKTLLDDVAVEACLTLRTLSIANLSKSPCPIIHPGVFLNLKVLEVSPHNLCEELVELLAEIRLPTLHLQQSEHSPTSFPPASPKAWRRAARSSPCLRVHLTLHSARPDKEIVWQEGAPVASILYNSPFHQIEGGVLNRAIEWYRETLELFGHIGLPKFSTSKSFTDREDPLLLMLVKECPKINTLIIREVVSTCTLLLIAEAGKGKIKDIYGEEDKVCPPKYYQPNIKYQFNQLVSFCDWPISPDWTKEYLRWLQATCKSYEKTEREIGRILMRQWTMLSDNEFVSLQPKMF